jgi:hypothetical protein
MKQIFEYVSIHECIKLKISISHETGLEIKTASYPTKRKQSPPSWNEKRMFLFITLFVGPDICINTLHYFPLR